MTDKQQTTLVAHNYPSTAHFALVAVIDHAVEVEEEMQEYCPGQRQRSLLLCVELVVQQPLSSMVIE